MLEVYHQWDILGYLNLTCKIAPNGTNCALFPGRVNSPGFWLRYRVGENALIDRHCSRRGTKIEANLVKWKWSWHGTASVVPRPYLCFLFWWSRVQALCAFGVSRSQDKRISPDGREQKLEKASFRSAQENLLLLVDISNGARRSIHRFDTLKPGSHVYSKRKERKSSHRLALALASRISPFEPVACVCACFICVIRALEFVHHLRFISDVIVSALLKIPGLDLSPLMMRERSKTW